jgi:hypothetical protein
METMDKRASDARIPRFALACVAAALPFAALPAQAEAVVVPNAQAHVGGNSATAVPFHLTGWGVPAARYQQVYAGSEFGGLSGIISEIAFRRSAVFPDPFSAGGIDVEIRLSHTTVDPYAMFPDFADNITAPQTLVMDTSDLSLASLGLVGEFDIVLDIDDLFVYDGVSNLLLDITVSLFDAVWGAPGTSVTVAYSSDATWGVGSPTALVTRFTIESTAVPEPGTLALFGAALGALALRNHRTRRRL